MRLTSIIASTGSLGHGIGLATGLAQPKVERVVQRVYWFLMVSSKKGQVGRL